MPPDRRCSAIATEGSSISTPDNGASARQRARAVPPSVALRRLILTLLITIGIFVVEAVGGWLSGSLALLSDAGHMLTDILALGLSLFAILLASRPADARRTYGYYRVEIISSFINGILLFSLSAGLFYSAWTRLQNPREIEGGLMMAVAAAGLAGNILGAILLMNLRTNLNLRAAFLHVISDGISSVGVLVGSYFIRVYKAYTVDVVLGMLIACLIVYSSLRLLHEATSVLMESTPAGIEISRVRDALLQIPSIAAVHDLHIWSISTNIPALSAHIVVRDAETIDNHRLLEDVHCKLEENFCVFHTTIQIENESFRKNCTGERHGRLEGSS